MLLAALFPDLLLASTVAPLLLSPLTILGGFFVNLDTVPWFLRWISFISPFNYGFKAGMISILEGETFYCKIGKIEVNCDPLKTIGANYSLSSYLAFLFLIGLGL